MKNKITILITLLIIGAQASKSVPVGTDLELIPAPRNLGININQASQKLTVNGAIALTNLGSNPVVISSQPSLFVKDNGLFYKSTLHANPFRIDLNDTNNSTFTNPTLVNPLIKGSISFDSSAKLNSFIVNGAVGANLFNGGLFRGDGSGLTNISSSNITNFSIDALSDGKTDSSSIFLGSNSGNSDDGNNNNIGLGINSLQNITSGSSNIAIGNNSFVSLKKGKANLTIGNDLGTNSCYGGNNIFIGNSVKNNISCPGNKYDVNNDDLIDKNDSNAILTCLNTNCNNMIFDINEDGSVSPLDLLTLNNFISSGPNNNILIGNNIEVAQKDENGVLSISNLIYGTNILSTGSAISPGNIGIGKPSPSEKLDVAGNIKADKFIGDGAGLINISSSGITNLSIDSLSDAKSDSDSVFLGAGAGTNHSGLTKSTGIGVDALKNSSSNSQYNTAVGYMSLMSNNEGDYNVGVGRETLKLNLSGSNNTAVGDGSLNKNSLGSKNTSIGAQAMFMNETGSFNNSMGYLSLFNNTSGASNLGIGAQSLLNNTTGNNNTALGNNAGSTITTGSNNIAIGADTQVASATGNNQLNIGNLLTGSLAQSNPDGTFSGGNLNINGGANIKGILDVDGSIVSRGKILSPNNPWILVHSENFQTTPVGWNNNTTTDCGGKRILGGFNTSSTSPLSKSFDLSAHPHTHVMVKFNYYSLDSWDNEMGFLRIDGLGTWSSQNLVYNDDDRAIITNCGTGGYSSNTTLGKDRVITGEARIDHTSNTLSLNFGSSLNETPDLESYGIDNLEIWIKTPGIDVSLNPPDPGISGNCGPNGYYTIQASDLTNPGNYLDPPGVGLANADYSKCRNLLFVEGGHSVTRTWNFINPSTPGNVMFKIERRRSGSPGVGVRYWFPTNVTGIPNPMDITLPNADINISCLYSNNSYSCTHSVTPL